MCLYKSYYKIYLFYYEFPEIGNVYRSTDNNTFHRYAHQFNLQLTYLAKSPLHELRHACNGDFYSMRL